MALQPQCVVCARPRQIPKRADCRYCGSSCRVRAFRVRKKRQLPTSTAIREPKREAHQSSGSLLDDTRMQLGMLMMLMQLWQMMPPMYPGAIPKLLVSWEAQMQRLLFPARRSDRSHPRAVKLKMSNYARKRPVSVGREA